MYISKRYITKIKNNMAKFNRRKIKIAHCERAILMGLIIGRLSMQVRLDQHTAN